MASLTVERDAVRAVVLDGRMHLLLLHTRDFGNPAFGDVLGAWFLSILAGHHRHGHITALRSDVVSSQILGMRKVISEDALRRALARMSSDESQNWLRPQFFSSVQAALNTLWILDIDTTIKTLLGSVSRWGTSIPSQWNRINIMT